ncbi:hypothetical protein P175DRAFT_0433083 [Aspergillus ochraceoroseus IBT 24754]|uniref:VPS37 C-terminal domain-containing protein n=3 Tax=Aspergillus subgen. Nidulantes TaxID=2720870 RepID=A0A0F8X6M3_9EURO|nr:uncharacterized protein P175DRAFT_0433083 [Aspergillus ochraceoroseus IBT 24754]KKK23120.1 hypothetical protein AOCH_004948 [Aspergillus ochraceoroseus]KKK25270.1 hypothetical protein ARAM_000703 [Aspergillus rambellii]PTU22474.1 hypothetical protein P175DRAFT_0433083 [Aspergillus ochraceoroseus IBT 24754]
MNPALHPDTPPPPPPKPGSHEASRKGTPQVNSPAPGTPQLFQQGQYGPGGTTQLGNRYLSSDTPNAGNVLPQPPTIEEGWLPEGVKEKPTVDLQTILTSPDLISALSSHHPSYAAHQQTLQSLLKYNHDLANHLLELQSRLGDLRSSTEKLLLTHQSLEVSWRKKQSELDTALAPWSPKALYQRLAASIAEQEAVCQAVEESFLEEEQRHGRATEKEVGDWIRRVRAESAKLEARREAKSRWDEGRVGGWR